MFLVFPSLPAELLLKIWELATPDHGAIVLNLCNGLVENADMLFHLLLHASSECRTVFLCHFPINLPPKNGSPKRIAVDFAHDLFYLQGFETYKMFKRRCSTPLSELQNIVEDNSQWSSRMNYGNQVVSKIEELLPNHYLSQKWKRLLIRDSGPDPAVVSLYVPWFYQTCNESYTTICSLLIRSGSLSMN
jgi:hypothetical protein